MLDIMVSREKREYLADQGKVLPSEHNNIHKEHMNSGKLCCEFTGQWKTAENFKSKKTARVAPMTRNTTVSSYDKSVKATDEDCIRRNTAAATNPLLPAAIAVGSSVGKQNSDDSCLESLNKGQPLIKKRRNKRSACKSENKRLAAMTGKRVERTILPAPSKEPKMEPEVKKSLSCSHPLQSSTTLPQAGNMSPEPRLMSENLLTMSLLSVSECHLATLQDEDGDTPLHIAIAQNNQGLTAYLVQLMSMAGLTVDIYNNLKQTPLHLAVITQQPMTIRSLISAGSNVNLPDRNGQTGLHLACQRSDLVCLKQLMSAPTPEIANCEAVNFDGFKPLHLAVFADNVDLISCLIENGADVNCKDGKSGRAPLHHAVETDKISVITTLVRLGAKINARSLSGCTPMQIAVGRGMNNIVKLLSESLADNEVQKQSSSWLDSGAYK